MGHGSAIDTHCHRAHGGVQLQPQQGLLGFTCGNWDIGAEFGDMARSNGLLLTHTIGWWVVNRVSCPQQRNLQTTPFPMGRAPSLHMRASIPSNWGPSPAPDRAMTATEQTGFVQQPVQLYHHNTKNTSLPTETMAKDKASIHIKNSPRIKNCEPTRSAQGYSYIQTAFRTQ